MGVRVHQGDYTHTHANAHTHKQALAHSLVPTQLA